MATSTKTIHQAQSGRPRGTARTGPGYRLAEWLDKNWAQIVGGASNDAIAQKMNYRSPNIISMWRTGKTKIALDRLIELSQMFKIDLATVLPLWFEQQLGEPGDNRKDMEAKYDPVVKTLARLATVEEFAIINKLRDHFPAQVPAMEAEQIDAMLLIAKHPSLSEELENLAKANKLS